jgi:16S rRNA (cytosine1402-N4)-methyltransferase
MVAEVLAGIAAAPGKCLVDGTVGCGGHSLELLKATAPDGKLFGCDRDASAVEWATERLAEFAGRFEIRVGPFAELSQWIESGSCDGVLLDLGVSSPQLDEAERGFAFSTNGALDMRMDRRQKQTAADLVNRLGVEERASRRLARAIEQQRQITRFETTRQLAGFVERVMPRGGARIHPATRVFQALRIAVNDELGNLRRGLDAAWSVLKPGGRLAVISFHSLEDRIVKEFGRNLAMDYVAATPVDVPELRRPKRPESRWVNRKPILPGEAEIALNPRARSARLRIMEKI